MLRNMRTSLEDRDKYGILKKKLAGSHRLKVTLEHLELVPEDSPKRTWRWLSQQIDKIIIDDRKKP